MATIQIFGQPYEIELAVFDKDGTLIDFTGLWTHYTTGAVEGLDHS